MTLTEAQAMTPEEKRVKLAELLGWKSVKILSEAILGRPPKTTDQYIDIPDYCQDLNVVAEVEKTLTDEQWEDYADSLLYEVVTAEGYSNYTSVRRAREATADECATALILTLSQA